VAKKAPVKGYTVFKRFSVALALEIPATSFNDAVEKAQALTYRDMSNGDINDYTELAGFGVLENE
jgi:hypothetical protein